MRFSFSHLSRQTSQRSVIAVALAGVLIGCGQMIVPGHRPKPERVVSRNYVVGERQTARVGDPIIRVRDYSIHRSQPFMRATDDFVLKADGLVVEGYHDEDYAVRGETTVDGKRFTVVSLPPFKRWPYLFKSDGPAALVDKDGTIYNRLMDGNRVMAPAFKLEPAGVRLLPTKQGKILPGSVHANYELVYGGTDGETIHVTFREYSKDNPDEVSHFQNLVLPHDSPAMRFKDVLLEIHHADAQELVYTVVSDESRDRTKSY